MKKILIQAEIGKIFMSSLLSSKLDDTTRNYVMPKLAPEAKDIPDCDKMFEIINTKFINTAQQSTEAKTPKSVAVSVVGTSNRKKHCYISERDGHQTYQCRKLLDTPVSDRFKLVKSNNVCINCLNGKRGACPCDKNHQNHIASTRGVHGCIMNCCMTTTSSPSREPRRRQW